MTNHKDSVFLTRPEREIQAVLFDMDGVLADSIPFHIMAWKKTLQAHQLRDMDRATYMTFLGKTNLYMIDKILEKQGISLPLEKRMELVETKEHFFRSLIQGHLQPTPGVIDWLEYFKKYHICCSVASSGEMGNISLVLQTLRIADYFTSILSGSHLGVSKPDPLIFLLAAASLGVSADKCLVIEDAPAGIQAARVAGMVSCGIATTLPEEDLKQADILVDNLSQLLPESFFVKTSHTF